MHVVPQQFPVSVFFAIDPRWHGPQNEQYMQSPQSSKHPNRVASICVFAGVCDIVASSCVSFERRVVTFAIVDRERRSTIAIARSTIVGGGRDRWVNTRRSRPVPGEGPLV